MLEIFGVYNAAVAQHYALLQLHHRVFFKRLYAAVFFVRHDGFRFFRNRIAAYQMLRNELRHVFGFHV